MTEAEWLTAETPRAMLEVLGERLTRRKEVLLRCANQRFYFVKLRDDYDAQMGLG